MAKSALISARLNSYLDDMAELAVSVPDEGCILTALPTELIHKILENINNGKDLINLMVTCKTLTQPAEEALWRICNAKGYAKLPGMSVEKRDRLMNWIRRLILAFEDDDMQSPDLSICPPRLQVLRLGHLSLHTTSPNRPVNISSFVNSSLTDLYIRNVVTDNFLPALSLVTGLKHLMIGAEVEVQNAVPMDLTRLVKAMPQLVSLYGGSLSSMGLVLEAANRKNMTEFAVAIHVDLQTIVQVLQIPNAFDALRRLCMWTPSSAICLLLPRLTNLETLQLNVSSALLPGETLTSGALDVFRVIGAMDKLTVLVVLLPGLGVPLPAKLFPPLANLAHLEKLRIFADSRHDAQLYEVEEFLPLHPSCSLKYLHLQLRQGIPPNWIQDLAKNHPNLETLSLGRSVKFRELSTPFPALKEISFVAPGVSCSGTNM